MCVSVTTNQGASSHDWYKGKRCWWQEIQGGKTGKEMCGCNTRGKVKAITCKTKWTTKVVSYIVEMLLPAASMVANRTAGILSGHSK